ncbi:MAG: SURF1 family protein [Steroidobacteraceae bacterium]
MFAPSWVMTALTIALCVAFVQLGRWQWHKAEWRQAEWNAFARGADRAVALGSRGTAAVPRFQRVVAAGRFDPAHQFLLDNRIENGDAGYEVLTPLTLDDGRVLLVDRGWVPFTGYRSRLPDVRLQASGPVRLTGRIDELPVGGLAFGRRAPDAGPHWPKVTSYPRMAQLAAVLAAAAPAVRLEPRILLLDPREPYGYVRAWQPPGMSPARHLSYAAQWWLFAVTLVVLWAVLSTPKRHANARPETPARQVPREGEVHR